MKQYKVKEIREKFLNFFKEHDHKIIPSASVLPENDTSVLFTSAGMQQLVPYLLGKKHPEGNKLANYQKCLRTVDIDEVGNNRHLTFFEMLGNWSLGAYFKEEAIQNSFDFLTKSLEIPLEKLSVTCFEGDEDAPRDNVSRDAWIKAGMPEERIYFFGKSENWWIAGDSGPCGPDTEMFYDTGKEPCSENCNPSCDCGKYVEIWNNVFMEYYKDEKGYRKLEQKNVDAGMGLERITMVLNGVETPYDLEIFKPVMDELLKLSADNQKENIESRRIVAEHLRSSSIIIADGGLPKNTDSGYILRRLIRRTIRHINKLGIKFNKLKDILKLSIEVSSDLYPEIKKNEDKILNIIEDEKEKFVKTLIKGEKEFNKLVDHKKNELKISKDEELKLNSKEIFTLYERYGLPYEITIEIAKDRNIEVETDELEKLFEEHQNKSKDKSGQRFKGGLADTSEKTIHYHTATHLLHAGLQEILGKHATQRGSNINQERLRFDFSHPEKVTKEELKEVEDYVNKKIQEKIDVEKIETTYDKVKEMGAIGLFEDKYQDVVTIYKIGDFSFELCGGPHVKNTGELGHFKITKEESSSKGVRRIKAILED